MNERIRLIWAECVIKHTKDPMNWQTVADEFAEFIIKECARIADEKPPYVGCGYITKTKGMLIKEHFGVDYEL